MDGNYKKGASLRAGIEFEFKIFGGIHAYFIFDILVIHPFGVGNDIIAM